MRRPAAPRSINSCWTHGQESSIAWWCGSWTVSGAPWSTCLNHIRVLEEYNVRFIAVTQGLDTDLQNPASRFFLHVLAAAAEFERSLIRERTQTGQMRYRQDFENGRVGKTVYGRSGRNMPPHRPRRVFDREEVFRLRRQGRSYRNIAKSLGLGLGTVVRTLQSRSKSP